MCLHCTVLFCIVSWPYLMYVLPTYKYMCLTRFLLAIYYKVEKPYIIRNNNDIPMTHIVTRNRNNWWLDRASLRANLWGDRGYPKSGGIVLIRDLCLRRTEQSGRIVLIKQFCFRRAVRPDGVTDGSQLFDYHRSIRLHHRQHFRQVQNIGGMKT